MAEKRCQHKCGEWNCGSYQFNLYKDDIEQGNLCDVHYWQTQAPRPWVGLTDEEMSDIAADMDVDFGDLLWKVVCLTKIIEATLKERNT
jgi:hypothetical protein